MTENTGLIPGRRGTDWVGGTMPYEIRVPSGDWRPYLPTNEKQKDPLETMACVSFSFNNSMEMQYKLLTGIERNFSDRWLAKMSNTQPNGNYLWGVADTARIDGLVDEAVWPHIQTSDWDVYYSEIPVGIQAKGKEFLQNFEITYEWIDPTVESLKFHLKHAPIQVTLPGHAIVEVLCENDLMKYFDTYDPFLKTTSQARVQDALKIVLRQKNMNQTKLVLGKDGKTVWRCTPTPDIGIEGLKKIANVEGFVVPDVIPPASTL